MSEIVLLCCPFCGGDAEAIGHYIKGVANNYQFFVRCRKCKARPMHGFTYKKREKAIEAWNTRKPLQDIIEQLEANSFMTAATFDEDGFCNDDSEAVVYLDKAIQIVKEVGGIDG